MNTKLNDFKEALTQVKKWREEGDDESADFLLETLNKRFIQTIAAEFWEFELGTIAMMLKETA
jgi:hypothetical protein